MTVCVFVSALRPTALLVKIFHLRLHCRTLKYPSESTFEFQKISFFLSTVTVTVTVTQGPTLVLQGPRTVQVCTIKEREIFSSNSFLITVIFACFYFNFLTSIFSLTSLFRLEHFKSPKQKKFQIGTSFCEPLFLQKGMTPHEKSRKNLSSGTESILIHLFFENIL